MSEEKDYPKYQYSIFLCGSRDEQLVIRADTWEEFLDLKKKANAIIQAAEKKSAEVRAVSKTASNAPVQSAVSNNLNAGMCPIHNVPLKERQGKFGVFYSHSFKQGDVWRHCNGRTIK